MFWFREIVVTANVKKFHFGVAAIAGPNLGYDSSSKRKDGEAIGFRDWLASWRLGTPILVFSFTIFKAST